MSYDLYNKREEKEVLRNIRGILKKIYIKHEKMAFLDAKKLVEEVLGVSSHQLPIKLDVYWITHNMIKDGEIKGKIKGMPESGTFTLLKQINDNFIDIWQNKFIDLEEVNKNYNKVLNAIQIDMKDRNTIRESSFLMFYKWKTNNRPIRKLEIIDYEKLYKENFSIISSLPERIKIYVVNGLPGINVVVGSALLHFIYPDTFPIMDIRTTRLLQNFGYLGDDVRPETFNKHPENYNKFRSTILTIQEECKKAWTLREIDRALFAYDVAHYNKETKSYWK